MTTHLARIGGSIALIVFCTFYPFLPGRYDGLAVPLSGMAQVLGIVGLLLMPIGIFWLGYELRERQRRKRKLPSVRTGYYFALVSMLASSVAVITASLGAFVGISPSLSVLSLTFWVLIVWRLTPRLKALKQPGGDHFNAVPLYVVVIPTIVVVLQIALAGPAREFSRNRAIEQSAELLADIERYRGEHGHYPEFLQAVHKDYHPSVVGIEQFHYAPHAEGYNLFFERPALLLDFGIREFVVFNARDEHIMMSHAAWILAGPSRELHRRQGRPSVHDASRPHWKYFWFD